MNRKCTRCSWKVIDIKLSIEQRLKITNLLNQNKKLAAIKQVKEYSKTNLIDAKAIVLHLNKTFGNCIRCDYSDLKKENINCPKCNAFNYNWKS